MGNTAKCLWVLPRWETSESVSLPVDGYYMHTYVNWLHGETAALVSQNVHCPSGAKGTKCRRTG